MPVTLETKQKIFESLKKVMRKFSPPLANKKLQAYSPTPTEGEADSSYELIGNIETTYGSKKEIVPGMYFASTMIRKDSVVFYFFPTYLNEKEFKSIAPLTYKCLKGKTCFHFKKEADVNEKELNDMIKLGIVAYKKQGWIK